MDRPAAVDTESLNSIIAWAAYADSVDKLNFLKSFCLNLGLEELSKLSRINAHVRQRTDVRKRKWTGITWDEYKKAKQRSLEQIPSKEVTTKLQPTASKPVELQLAPIPLPKLTPWWDEVKLVAIDVEKVAKFIFDDSKKVIGHCQQAAEVGIVDDTYKTLLHKTIFHKPGSFNTHPKTVEITGFRKFDLQNGESFDSVIHQVKDAIGTKTVITVAGQNDFESLENNSKNPTRLYDDTFDLQSFYRRPSKNDPYGTEPMSLRDICFHHFKEDIQFKKPHNVIDDAKNTMRAFLEGYIPWKIVHGNPSIRGNVENCDFSEVPNLKKYAEKGEFYCKPSNDFKKDCPCDYCKQYKY